MCWRLDPTPVVVALVAGRGNEIATNVRLPRPFLEIYIYRHLCLFAALCTIGVIVYLPFDALAVRPFQAKDGSATAEPSQSKAIPNGEHADVVIKRRHQLTDEDLRKQLFAVLEVGFDQSAVAVLLKSFQNPSDKGQRPPDLVPPDVGLRFLGDIAARVGRPDFVMLPLRAGLDCQLGKEPAENLHMASVQLRDMLREATPAKGVRPDADKLREFFATGTKKHGETFKPKDWRKPETVPALVQLLQVESTAVRLLLVERLTKIDDPKASVAIAQCAIFDLSPTVREQAVRALAKRPLDEYRPVLLDSFRWPWAAAADHAAEAVTALNAKEMLPGLVTLLKEPDPALPVATKIDGKDAYVLREPVRINHMCNCILCHAPSLAKDDLIRGRVPIPGEAPPPLYYTATQGTFVRAEFTFLRQDFSVVQPVPVAGTWPGQQRFDYLIRTRPLTNAEATIFAKKQKTKEGPPATTTYPQRDAILFTLRELTQRDAGQSPEAWADVVKTIIEKK